MKFRLTAVLASALLLWGSAYAQQQPDTANVPESSGATAPGIVILELQGASPAQTPEETLAMQLLLLQLLMMQSEAAASVAPGASGTGI
jgi:hypothetical protein